MSVSWSFLMCALLFRIHFDIDLSGNPQLAREALTSFPVPCQYTLLNGPSVWLHCTNTFEVARAQSYAMKDIWVRWWQRLIKVFVFPSAQTVLECRNQSSLLLWWGEIRGYGAASILRHFSQGCSRFLLLINGQRTDTGSRESGIQCQPTLCKWSLWVFWVLMQHWHEVTSSSPDSSYSGVLDQYV